MFNTKWHLAFPGILATALSCANGSAATLEHGPEKVTTVYANEYGEIHLTEINDSVMHAIFFDNEKEVFDTVMRIDYDFQMLSSDDDFPFLWIKTGGVKLYENRIEIYDFAGPATMGMYVAIENLYERPFYKLNDTIVINDVIENQKGGQNIAGMYVIPESTYSSQFVAMTGVIKKEKYPRAYYSTSDGPQGMFADTNKTYYRLVIEPVCIREVEKYAYTGRTMNINGEAAFIWEFADSEAYYLDNHAPWTEEELDKEITIEAVLVQFINGKSVLKSWEIID